MEAVERFIGCLGGLAVGDALGTTLEFRPPGTFQPIDDMVGGGKFGLRAGQWTDDTSMALCLAESLIECRGFDPADQMQRYLRWSREGYLSSTGRCFDIGNTVAAALRWFEQSGNPFSGSGDPHTAGNGSLMRLAPVPLAFFRAPRQAMERAADSSRTTHGAPQAIDACRYCAALIVGALEGREKEELLAPRFCPVSGYWQEHSLCAEIDRVAAGSFKDRRPPAIRGRGYVVDSLEAALWAFHRGRSFREGCLLAVNLGDDADTTGAIYGQLAGACYGIAEVPPRWWEKIAMREKIEGCARSLLALSQALREGA